MTSLLYPDKILENVSIHSLCFREVAIAMALGLSIIQLYFISRKYDVADTILQGTEKMKVQYLRSLLFDLFEILQAVGSEHRNFARFQISLIWQLKR